MAISSYSPWPIYDIKTGLYFAKEPWLAPKDAFVNLLNARIYQGKIIKRRGTTLFGRMVHQVLNEAVGTSGSTTYAGTLAHYPVKAGDSVSRFNFTSGTQVLTDADGDGVLTGSGTGTINYETGEFSITFGATTSASVTADYQYYPGLPIMGIYEYYDSQGSASLLVWDTKRCNQWFPLENAFNDIVNIDTWTGGANDLIWTENWSDLMFITNNVDQVKYFNGTSFSDLVIDFTGDGVNDVNTCLMIFTYKQRLVILRPTENGTLYPQRVRWSTPGTWNNWTNDGYIDAPTLDWIVSASFLGDDLIVFFERSIWALRYLGDVDLPFVWRKIVDTEGSYATYSTVNFSDELITLGPTGLIATDGFDIIRVDENKIPDIALDIDQEHYDLCYGATLEEDRETWMLYPEIGSDHANRVLVLNYASNAWSIYDFSLHTIGYWETNIDPTWDQIDQTWDELERIWDERTSQAGYPITLGGTFDGKILRVNDGGTDLGVPIKLDIKSGRWNPFIEQGNRARLGKIDFLFTRDDAITINVDFYTDFNSTPYKTTQIQLDGADEKVWKTIHVGQDGSTHQIRIWHEAANQTVEIHAIIPWFKPSGRLV